MVPYLFRTNHDPSLFKAGCKSEIHWDNIFELNSLDEIAEEQFKIISTSTQSSHLTSVPEIAQEIETD